jgi:hypothetical protein
MKMVHTSLKDHTKAQATTGMMKRLLWPLGTRRSLFSVDQQCLSLPRRRSCYHLVMVVGPAAEAAATSLPQGGGGQPVRWMGGYGAAASAADEDGDHDDVGVTADTPMLRFSTLRRIIKPFLLKCHPDTTPTVFAKKVSLLRLV